MNDNNRIDPHDFWSDRDPPIFPKGLLPAQIETFARGASLSLGADIGGVALAALAAAAFAIHDNIKLQVIPFSDWLEAARLWLVLIGPPSTKKTPTITAVTEMLRREDGRLWAQYIRRKEAWDALPKADRLLTPEPIKG
jgi:hypothetical protein